jgi:hypothetical protein
VIRAVHAEFRKLFTTKTGFALTLVSVALTALLTILFGTNVSHDDGSGPELLRDLITIGSNFGFLLAAIIGIIGLTGEYRHLTVTPTFLGTPVRSVVVAAKIVTYAFWGFVIGVLNLVVGLAIAIPVLSHRSFDDVSLSSPGVWDAMWGAVLTTVIFSVIGVGLGALLRNQIAAIVALVLYLFVIENILGSIKAVKGVYAYLPGGLTQALIQPGSDFGTSGIHLLDRGPAALLLIAYGIAFAIVGALLTVSRDIT